MPSATLLQSNVAKMVQWQKFRNFSEFFGIFRNFLEFFGIKKSMGHFYPNSNQVIFQPILDNFVSIYSRVLS